jgi:hypothetical protein
MRPVPIARKDALIEIHEDDVLIAGLVGRKRLSQAGERFCHQQLELTGAGNK